MKRIIALLTVSVLLLLSGCSIAAKPNFSVYQKGIAEVIYDENEWEAEFDFFGEKQLVILKSEQTAFPTRYVFEKQTITLTYDDITTELDIGGVPDTNTALLIYRILHALGSENTKWKSEKGVFYFQTRIHDVFCSGMCEKSGKLISCEVPEYKFYLKVKNLV